MRARFGSLVFALAVLLAVPWQQQGALAAEHPQRPAGVKLAPLFALTPHRGEPLTRATLRGSPALLMFGYTSCADICPTSLFDVSMNLRRLGEEADRLRVFFVTVDPERDTPAQLGAYLSSFDERIVGLTGTRAEIDALVEAFLKPQTDPEREETNEGASHSSDVFLLDPYGMLARRVAFQDHEALFTYSRRVLAQQRPKGGSR